MTCTLGAASDLAAAPADVSPRAGRATCGEFLRTQPEVDNDVWSGAEPVGHCAWVPRRAADGTTW